ncbi:MAG: hypothetical protein ACPGGA_07685 [Balneolaceae bacterium]
MNKKNYLWIFILIFGVVSVATTAPRKKIKYSVKLIDTTWFVVDENNNPKAIEADKNDDIEWTAEGSDMTFQFPLSMSTLFTNEDGSPVGDAYVIEVENGKKLTLKVKSDAPSGRYVYSVYVKVGDTFAEGSTPPVMIIK